MKVDKHPLPFAMCAGCPAKAHYIIRLNFTDIDLCEDHMKQLHIALTELFGPVEKVNGATKRDFNPAAIRAVP